jgi:DNA-binding MarR family transcriptional regulator
MAGPDAFQAELDTRLGASIKRAEQALMAAKSAALAPYGVTVPQYSALLLLAYTPEASAAQLSRACAVTPQSMATVVENLEAKGLVTREPSPLHRRVMAVRLTDAGRALVTEADRAAKAIENSLLAAFTNHESEELRTLLGRAIDVLTSETTRS